MKFLLILNILALFLFSCNQTKENNQTYVYDDTFELDLKIFKVKYKDSIYPIVLEESSFYSMLNEAHKISNKIAYFKHRKTYWKFIIPIDSVAYNNIKSHIVFENSSNNRKVIEYYRKIKDHSKREGQVLNFDTNYTQMDRTHIFYLMLKDSMLIGQQDVSGDYILLGY
jgi:hypothetical protein